MVIPLSSVVLEATWDVSDINSSLLHTVCIPIIIKTCAIKTVVRMWQVKIHGGYVVCLNRFQCSKQC